ncbi:hypothetical protein BDY17DRAFT_323984 [Neohortaea acidophila]|uniref:Uncharacterized protein n=1 Tax=Neohortaea acidophila TaxID=245834 RepID=A0A6A6PU68_9PEZI|nr:uncharacterized protein BDY17DRAFT_323984 [Neohortaea acidophila]KAF2483231.1 hypothetical protein BDY17DRAFT_323984 [Neohortaea acidophila]
MDTMDTSTPDTTTEPDDTTQLDKMCDNEKVLVYHYRGENSILKRNLQQITRGQLADILEDNPNIQATRKRITSSDRNADGEVCLEIQQNDLYTPAQKEMYKEKSLFNYYSNIAGVEIKRHVAQHFSELIILSKKKD